MKTLPVILAIALLVGCTHRTLNAVAPKLTGMSVDEVISLLGSPQSQAQVSGDRFISWTNSTRVTLYVPQTTTSTSYENIERSAAQTKIVTKRTKARTTSLHCKFTVQVNEANQVVAANHDGDQHACRHFAAQLSDLNTSG